MNEAEFGCTVSPVRILGISYLEPIKVKTKQSDLSFMCPVTHLRCRLPWVRVSVDCGGKHTHATTVLAFLTPTVRRATISMSLCSDASPIRTGLGDLYCQGKERE